MLIKIQELLSSISVQFINSDLKDMNIMRGNKCFVLFFLFKLSVSQQENYGNDCSIDFYGTGKCLTLEECDYIKTLKKKFRHLSSEKRELFKNSQFNCESENGFKGLYCCVEQPKNDDRSDCVILTESEEFKGTCVEDFSQCLIIDEIINVYQSTSDTRLTNFLQKTPCGDFPERMSVCCPSSEIYDEIRHFLKLDDFIREYF